MVTQQELVTVKDLVVLTGRKKRNIESLLYRKRVPIVRRVRGSSAGLYDKTVALEAIGSAHDPWHQKAPAGHVTVRDAEQLTGISKTTLAWRIKCRRIKVLTVKYGHATRHYIPDAEVERLKAEHQPSGRALANALELAEEFQVDVSVVHRRMHVCNISPVVNRGRSSSLALYDLERARHALRAYGITPTVDVPEGFLTPEDAAARLGIAGQTVRDLVRKGLLESLRVSWGDSGTRYRVFICEKGLVEFAKTYKPPQHGLTAADRADEKRQRYQAEAIRKRKSKMVGGYEPTHRPLISANDFECLEARRKLLAKRGIRLAGIRVTSTRTQ